MSPALPAPAAEAAGPRPGFGLGRPAVILSIVLHVAGFVVAVGVPRLLASGPTSGKVYVVDLVSLPGMPAASPAPAAAAAPPPAAAPKQAPPAKKEPAVKKPPAKPIALPDRNTKKPPVKPEKAAPTKPPEPKKPAPEPAADENNAADDTAASETPATENPAAAAPAAADQGAAPKGTAGGAGAGTAGTGTAGGDEYDFYLALLDRKIRAAWKRPVSTGRDTRTATVRLELTPTGRLLKLELSGPSGFAPLDRSVLQAVRDAEPFPPFPLALKLDRLPVQIEFELTPEEGGSPNPGD